jgi:hypothetical protein
MGKPASGGTGTAGPGSTSDERRASIDRRLDDSIGTLDREIRKEQEKTAQERDARAAANAGNSGSSSNGDDADKKDGDSASGTAGTEGPGGAADGKGKDSKSNRPGDLKSDKQRKAEGNSNGGGNSGNNGGAQGSGAGATEIPDGSDDDIVARRLRKAAEGETDPELKEKLWKEYIEYKKGAGK